MASSCTVAKKAAVTQPTAAATVAARARRQRRGSDAFLGKLSALLKSLPLERRRAVLVSCMTQTQRLALERWMLVRRDISASSACGQPTPGGNGEQFRAPSCCGSTLSTTCGRQATPTTGDARRRRGMFSDPTSCGKRNRDRSRSKRLKMGCWPSNGTANSIRTVGTDKDICSNGRSSDDLDMGSDLRSCSADCGGCASCSNGLSGVGGSSANTFNMCFRLPSGGGAECKIRDAMPSDAPAVDVLSATGSLGPAAPARLRDSPKSIGWDSAHAGVGDLSCDGLRSAVRPSSGRSDDCIAGIMRHYRGGQGVRHRGTCYYSAYAMIGNMQLLTKTDKSLDVVLIHRAALAAITQKVKADTPSQEVERFEDRFREAVMSTLRELCITAERIGLRFLVSVKAFGLSTPLRTRPYRVPADMDAGLCAWRRLVDAAGKGSTAGVPHAGKVASTVGRCHTSDLSPGWARIREAYLCVMCDAGCCRGRVSAKLDVLEAQLWRRRKSGALAVQHESKPTRGECVWHLPTPRKVRDGRSAEPIASLRTQMARRIQTLHRRTSAMVGRISSSGHAVGSDVRPGAERELTAPCAEREIQRLLSRWKP